MTVPLANAFPLIAVLAFLALAGFVCHWVERCIRDRCDRPCCAPTHDESPAALDGHRALSSIARERNEL